MTDTNQQQDSDTTLSQDRVAPALSYIPIEVVSVRTREHQHFERDKAGIVRRSESMKKVEGGRRPTKGRRGAV